MISVIYEDKNFVVLNKSAGVLVHRVPGKKNSEESVVDWLLKNYPEVKGVGDNPVMRPGIVHRLDKDTSGVILAARNQKAFLYLKKLFQEHRVIKKYLALVWGKLEGRGVIKAPIGLKAGTVKRTTRGKMKMVKAAITEYKVLKKIEKNGQTFTLVELTPKTGRTHQLRIHLSSIHHPVVGDALYDPKENPFELKRQFLHARSLEFTTPDSGRIKLEADLPRDLKKHCEAQVF